MKYGWKTGRVVIAALLALVSATSSCRSVPFMGDGKKEQAEEKLQQELRLQLEAFSAQFYSGFEVVIQDVLETHPAPAVERRLLAARLHVMPTFRALLAHPDARVVFLDMWAFCAQYEVRLAADDPHLIGLDTARAMLDELIISLRQIGGTFLEEEQLEEVEQEVQKFARESSAGQRFSIFYKQDEQGQSLGSAVGSIVTTPLGAFNPFGGIDATAAAIHDASAVGDRFATIIQQMPEVLRWEIELILHELRYSPQMTSLVASIAEVSAGAAGIEQAVRSLPEDVTQVLAETQATQASLRETMVEARATMSELDSTLKQVEPLLASVERTTSSVTDAGTAWEGTVRAVEDLMATFASDDGEEADAEPAGTVEEEPAEPFRILDYAETAEQLAAAAAELNTLLVEVRGVIGGDELALVAESVSETASSTVDHVVFRAAELVLLLVAAVIVLRVFWNRTRPASAVDEAP